MSHQWSNLAVVKGGGDEGSIMALVHDLRTIGFRQPIVLSSIDCLAQDTAKTLAKQFGSEVEGHQAITVAIDKEPREIFGGMYEPESRHIFRGLDRRKSVKSRPSSNGVVVVVPPHCWEDSKSFFRDALPGQVDEEMDAMFITPGHSLAMAM